MRFSWLLIIGSLIELFTLNIKAVHINKDLQNLSIESSGNLKNDDIDKTISANNTNYINNNTNIDVNGTNANFNNTEVNTSNETIVNRTSSNDNSNIEINNKTNKTESNSEDYHLFDGVIDWRNTTFKDGIAYNSKFK